MYGCLGASPSLAHNASLVQNANSESRPKVESYFLKREEYFNLIIVVYLCIL